MAEWLNAAVLKSARWYYHARQINNLRYTVLHGNGVFWATLAHFCATECATAGILCNSTVVGFERIDVTGVVRSSIW
jgi:hypothetical protein